MKLLGREEEKDFQSYTEYWSTYYLILTTVLRSQHQHLNFHDMITFENFEKKNKSLAYSSPWTFPLLKKKEKKTTLVKVLYFLPCTHDDLI